MPDIKTAGLLGGCRVKSPRHAVVAQLVERQSSKLVIFCAGSSPVHRSDLFLKCFFDKKFLLYNRF
nr:MAG TPA: hypothetical protein [Bacteriophage sp.]